MCQTVLLGMSGGTDSSVAAMLLRQQGYEVKGVTFRFFDSESSEKHLEDARKTASALGIEHFVYDARQIFKKEIIDYFIEEYLSGRTPVPCIKCNNQIKWRLLEELAGEHNCAKIATGHYCKIIQKDGFFHISAGDDKDKDQSFFLWGLAQSTLSKVLLPLGGLTKTEVRRIAAGNGFQRIAEKKDSLGVCFCPGDYRYFLCSQSAMPRLTRYPLVQQEIVGQTHNDKGFSKGNFTDENGNILGQHEGYPFYTVGQRRGLGIHLNKAIFVKEINPKTNTVVLAPLKSLYKTEFYLKDWNLINENYFTDKFDIIVKIRYRKQATPARVIKTENFLLKVELGEPLESIAPGQAAAFYKDDFVIGGGIIV